METEISNLSLVLLIKLNSGENSAVKSLKFLGRIVTILKNASFKKRLMEARSQRELFQLIAEEDEKY